MRKNMENARNAKNNPPTVDKYCQKITDAGFDEARVRQARVRLEQMGQTLQNLYFQCVMDKAPPRSRIKMFCIECMAYQRREVPLCTDKGCPLYGERPTFEPQKN